MERLIGKTLKIISINDDRDEILFYCDDGDIFKMYHEQRCCEIVNIDEINGDLEDLLNTPIIRASEDSSDELPLREKNDYNYNDSCTWTFYNITTNKGHVQIKWYGESNGFYSESVDFEQIYQPEDNK